jgi:hypothetical protein
MTKQSKVAVGEYSLEGYEVSVIQGTRTAAHYAAGNHKQDSTVRAEPGSLEALSLAQLRRFCQKTTKEMADEHQAVYGGVEKAAG